MCWAEIYIPKIVSYNSLENNWKTNFLQLCS